MPFVDIPFEQLPGQVQNNLTPEQWIKAQRGVVQHGDEVPETTQYINLKNGHVLQYTRGQKADGPLLATHDLAGSRGVDDTQFESSPPGARMP